MAMASTSTSASLPLGIAKPPFSRPRHGQAAHSVSIRSNFFIASSSSSSSSSSSFSSIYGLHLPSVSAQHRISMRASAKEAYICRDCGYIYNERKSFDSLTDDFRCPVCYAPKRRFRPYDLPVSKNVNQVDVRKARKEQIKNDAAIGNVLPIAIVVGLASLVGVYLYLNSQF